jgi:hypothetical protein
VRAKVYILLIICLSSTSFEEKPISGQRSKPAGVTTGVALATGVTAMPPVPLLLVGVTTGVIDPVAVIAGVTVVDAVAEVDGTLVGVTLTTGVVVVVTDTEGEGETVAEVEAVIKGVGVGVGLIRGVGVIPPCGKGVGGVNDGATVGVIANVV